MVRRRYRAGGGVAEVMLLGRALPPPSDGERLPGIILRGQGEHVPFDDAVTRPVGAERASDERRLSLENVGQGVILQIDRGTALAGDHAVPDVDTGRPEQIGRRFVCPDVHREIAAGVVDQGALAFENDWRLARWAEFE